MNETGAFNSLCNVVIVMGLSTKLILWNADWRKFLAASSESSQFRKRHCITKRTIESKRLTQKWWSWCHFTRIIIFYPKNKKQWHWIIDAVEITCRNCCIDFGPPCISVWDLFINNDNNFFFFLGGGGGAHLKSLCMPKNELWLKYLYQQLFWGRVLHMRISLASYTSTKYFQQAKKVYAQIFASISFIPKFATRELPHLVQYTSENNCTRK